MITEELLCKLLSILTPSGDESRMRDFLIAWFEENRSRFKSAPTLYYGDDYGDSLAVVFGKPRTAVYAHIDTVGFQVRYGKELIEIGSPDPLAGAILVDPFTLREYKLVNQGGIKHPTFEYDGEDILPPGTPLLYKPAWKATNTTWQAPYLDDRLGILNCLLLAFEIQDGILAFTTHEEHGGGSSGNMARIFYEKYKVRQSLISDVTWTSEGIVHGSGAVISIRDCNIPRRSYINRIIELIRQAGTPYQLEVEAFGSSDGGELGRIPYPIDWCFIGAPVSHMHSPKEIVHIQDFASINACYKILLASL
jgi:putative aminopeptidase FrvX